MSFTENLIQEFELESAITRRVLERVPADKLTWKPHPKSMSIGELALQVAEESGILAPTALAGGIDFGEQVNVRHPKNLAEILDVHDTGVKTVVNGLRQLGDAGLRRSWAAAINGAPSVPNAASVRRVIRFHRGELSMYLAVLDVIAPSISRPSADEASTVPAAAATATATA
jgi:hypothetical protein